MKKTIILFTALQLLALAAYSQALMLHQVEDVLKTWMDGSGKSSTDITNKLKVLNSKWEIKSEKPEVDGYTNTFTWSAPTEAGEPQYLVISIEEDEDSRKYSITYLMYHHAKFSNMVTEIKSLPINVSNAVELSDVSKREYTLTANKSNLNYFLKEQQMEDSKKNARTTFTVDIVSKYIKK